MHNKGFKDILKGKFILNHCIYFREQYRSPLLYFILSQQQLGRMVKLRHTLRKAVGNARRLPTEILDAIAAEVGASPRLGFSAFGADLFML